MTRRQRSILILFAIVALAAAGLFVIRRDAREPAPAPGVVLVQRVGPEWIYPDPASTPGAVNPDITQANIAETICNPEWSTKSIRPSSSYTTRLKKEQMARRHLSGATADYEEDHLISLELGGSPADTRNLWPEPYAPQPGARQKDVVENYLHKQVCAGTMPLQEAQRAIATDWYRVYLGIRRAHE